MLNRVHFPIRRSSCASALLHTASDATSSRTNSVEFEPEDRNLAAVGRALKLFLLSTDDPFCVLVRSYLQHLGFSLFRCTSAERAESVFLEKCDIDIWLIDVQSLGIEAMYFATKVRDLHPEIPVILVAGARRNEGILQRLFWQNWIRIRKPIELPDLLETIHTALSRAPTAPKATWQSGDWDSREYEDMNPLARLRARNQVLN